MRVLSLPIGGLCALLFALAAAHAAGPERIVFPGEGGAPLQGWVYAPTTAGRHPAVVALHGCAGLTDKSGGPSARHADWGQRLSTMGHVVLFPDSFASRGLGPQCRESKRAVRASSERVADTNAALGYLSNRADVDVRSISLIGWSNGGSSTLYAAQPKHTPGDVDFSRAIAFYPGCRTPLETGRWRSRLPLMILIGADDDWTPAAPCVELAAQAKAQGENVDIVVYPGAYHDFDHPDLPVHIVEGLAFTANGGGAAHTGTNAAARADAIKRVSDFLNR